MRGYHFLEDRLYVHSVQAESSGERQQIIKRLDYLCYGEYLWACCLAGSMTKPSSNCCFTLLGSFCIYICSFIIWWRYLTSYQCKTTADDRYMSLFICIPSTRSNHFTRQLLTVPQISMMVVFSHCTTQQTVLSKAGLTTANEESMLTFMVAQVGFSGNLCSRSACLHYHCNQAVAKLIFQFTAKGWATRTLQHFGEVCILPSIFCQFVIPCLPKFYWFVSRFWWC